MEICRASYDDLEEILELQHLAYKSEAALFGRDDIQPLTETIDELIEEYNEGFVLKMVSEDGRIVGSIRAKEDNGSVYIGKLMVHPDYQRQGHGTRLIQEIEKCFPGRRYELFTSTRSVKNIRLYEANGYRIFDERPEDGEIIFVYLEK